MAAQEATKSAVETSNAARLELLNTLIGFANFVIGHPLVNRTVRFIYNRALTLSSINVQYGMKKGGQGMRVKTEERRQAIIDTAYKVFQEEGFDRASMSEIAKRLGGSKATLYSYFNSKEELFTAVMKVSPEVGELFGPITDPNLKITSPKALREQLERFAVTYLKFHLSPNILAMRRNLIAQGDRSDVSRLSFEAGPRQNFIKLAEFLERAMEDGLLVKAI